MGIFECQLLSDLRLFSSFSFFLHLHQQKNYQFFFLFSIMINESHNLFEKFLQYLNKNYWLCVEEKFKKVFFSFVFLWTIEKVFFTQTKFGERKKNGKLLSALKGSLILFFLHHLQWFDDDIWKFDGFLRKLTLGFSRVFLYGIFK